MYEIFSLDGTKVGAGITIPVEEGKPMPELKSCILSSLEPNDVLKLLEQFSKTMPNNSNRRE